MRNQVVLLLVAVLLLGSCSDGAGRAEKADGEADASSDVAADVAQPDGTEVSDDVQTDLADQNDLTADTDGIEVDGQDTSDVTELVDFQTSVDVSTSTGELLGVESGGLRVFKGIPYAEPPVGDGRFRAPRGKAAWDGVLDASDFGASCLQGYATFNETSEDCLTLNVWAHTDTTPRPIMVWLYGGGFVLGESATPLYDGADLAVGADVVVVSLNYRLGLFGSLALPELQAEDARGAAGNMGLLDQIEALRWLKANAPAFGGDPNQLTVFGESAGGISVCALMGAPLADSLFQRAIIESGNCSLFASTQPSPRWTKTAFEVGEEVAAGLGCDSGDRLACLRALSAFELLAATEVSPFSGGLLTNELTYGPTIDGVVLPKKPFDRIAAGEAPVRDVLVGSNGNEGSLFTSPDVILSRQGFADRLTEEYGDAAVAQSVVDLYSPMEFFLAKDAFTAFVGEALFNCDTMLLTKHLAGRGFVYHLTAGPTSTMTTYGPTHGAEMFYVFGNMMVAGVVPTLYDLSLSDDIQAAWGAFAWTGAPSWTGGWPAMTAAAPSHLEISTFPSVESEFRGGRCELLDALGVLP